MAATTTLAMGRGAYACLPLGLTLAPTGVGTESVQQFQRLAGATVLIDVSGSMAGYVAPPRPAPPAPRPPARPVAAALPEPRIFRDLVLSLPQIVASIADRLTLQAVGRNVRPLSLAELPRASSPAFYREPESRIQEALAAMQAMPAGELGVLVTDLFLTGEEIFGGASAIRAPLARILDGDRVVGLMGVRSGFAGTIYDIPVVNTYDGATERPFFVVASGPPAAVARLFRRIETELLDPLLPNSDGQPRSHATIFARAPFPAAPLQLVPQASAPATAAAAILPDLGPGIARIGFPAAQGAARAPMALRDLVAGPVLLPDMFNVAEEVWAEAPRGARELCANRWIPIRSLLAPLAQVSLLDSTPVLAIGGPSLARLPPGVPFLVRARVATRGLSEAPAATAWTRDWNLEARDAEAFTRGRPGFFRALHLREVAMMLEGLVRDNFAPHTVGEAAIAFVVPKGR